MPGKYSAKQLILLRQQLNEYFSAEELKILCFDIGVDSEEVSVGNIRKSVLALNLITYLERRDRLDSLIEACKRTRPEVVWEHPIAITDAPRGAQERLRIFLCHASQDKPLVRILFSKLIRSGFEPWLDAENLLGGQEWELEITKAIRESHAIIICLSQESVSKTGFVQKEIRFAFDRALEQPEGSIFLIPLKLAPCEVPVRLRVFQWINYYEENGYQNLERALQARAAKLGNQN